MKAPHAQTGGVLCSPWHRLLLAGELPAGLEGAQQKVHRSQMEKEQNSLSGPAIAKQTGCLSICLGGREEELARGEEEA